MRTPIHDAFNPSSNGKALVGWLTGIAIRIINWLTGPGQRILTAAVALAVVLQMVPLAPPPPSQMVTALLADAPPPISSRAPFLAEALAPLDSVAPLFTTAPTPAIAAGAEITKTAPSEVDQGGTIAYTLVISQSSGSDWPANTVNVTDALPANTGSASGTPAGDWWYGTPDGVSTFINTSSPVTQGMWITVGILSVDTGDPLPDGTIISNNDYAVSGTIRATGSPVTTDVRAPAFSINKTTSSSPACAGGLLTYTISVSNTGRVTTVDPFTISDVVPSNVSFISAPDGGSYDPATRAVTWTVNTPLLKSGGTTVQRTFVVSVPYTLTDGTSVQNITYTVFSNEVTPDGVGPSRVITVSRVAPGFSVSPSVCVGSLVTFTNTSAGADAYVWDFGDGTPTSPLESPSHTYTSAGNYTVVLTATSGYGCPLSTTQQVVTVNPLPTPTLQISPTTAMVCTTVYFTDTDTSNVVSRTWDFGDGESTTTAISTTSHSYAVTIGNYTVTLTSTTASGCISSTQKMVTITVGPPAFITVTADPPALPIGQTSLLTATVTDCGANPVADGTVITFTSSPGWSGVNPVTGTTSSGVATSTITGTLPGGTATVTATAPNLISGTTYVEFHVADLTISKAIQPPTIVSSDTITYTLFYTNAGGAAAQGVYLTDTLPAGVTYGGLVSENPDWPGTPTYTVGPPQTVAWFTPTLAGGASGTIVITATVDFTDTVSAIFTNTVQITTTTPESDADNNIYQDSNWLSQTADVAISKVVTPTTPLQPGDRLTYTLTFTNVGYVTATGVVITDIYQPVSLTNVISDSSGIVTPTAATPPPYTWDVQDLSYGEGGVITISAQVDPAQTWDWSSILTNTAYITTAQPDGDGTNNTDEVTSIIQTADVVVSKQIQPPTVVSSDTITYTLTYTNAGAAPAQSVYLTDTLPAGVTYGGFSEYPGWPGTPTYTVGPPQTVTWFTPTLAGGASGIIVITATVDFTDVVSALFTNTVEITTTTPESDVSNNIYQDSNRLSQTADVTISKAVTPATTLHPNDMITYTLTFTNAGYAVATGVVITDIYQPISLTNVVSTSSGATVTPTAAAPPYIWDVQDLSYGEGGVITISARIDPGQPWPPTPTILTNTTFITTTTTDGNASNDSDQVTSTVVPGEPYTVSVAVSQLNPPICGTVLVTVTVTDEWNNLISGEIVDLYILCGTVVPNPVTTTNGVATSTLTAIASCTTSVLARAKSNGRSGLSNPVTFGPATLPTSISITANPNTLPADGSSTSLVTAVVTDCTGSANGVVVTFTISPALGAFPSTPYTATTNVNGIATGTLTAGTSTGTATVTATADSLVATIPVAFTDVSSISVTADPDTLPADGSSTSTVTAMVTDTLGLPANGVVVTFTISPALGTFPSTPYTATTNASGIATGTLTAGTYTGTATVTATADSLVATTLVTFTDASSISVTADPDTLPADGSSTSTVTAMVTDTLGLPANGVVVTFTISPALGTFPSTPYTATTNASGIATGTLTALVTPGLATVTATADSLVATTLVTFTDVGSISVTADPDTLPADGSSTSTVTVMVTDTLGSPASGVVVTFTISPALGAFLTTPYTATTNASGIATGTLTAGTSTGTATVTATADSLAATTPITFTAVLTGGDVYLPIVMKDFDVGSLPTGDLIVTNIAFDPSPPVTGTAYHVIVTIQNTGTLPVTNDFWVDLYLNPDTSTGHPVPPTVNHIWPDYCPGGRENPAANCYGAAWWVTTNLAPGETLDLSTNALVGSRYSNWPPPTYSSSHSPFYAQVDSWGYSYGSVSETDESNNTYGPQVAGAASAPMPAVPSGVPSPGSTPSGSWEPRPTLPPRSEPAMTITPTPMPTLPKATLSLPTSTPTPSPVPIPTVTPSATPELGMTDMPTAIPSPVPTTTATLPPEVTDTPTPTSTSTPTPIPTADLSEQGGEPTPPDLPSITPTTVPTFDADTIP